MVRNWATWSQKHDANDANTAWVARGACWVALRMVMQHLPTYTDKDLLVVNRAHKDGKESTQKVWTLNTFKVGELMLAPTSLDILDKMWTYQKTASVQMPAHGDFAWPLASTVAFDGRYK